MPKGAKFKVPRLYKAAAKVAKLVKEENADLEQLMQQNNKKTNVKALAALVNKCLNSEKMLDTVIKNSEILIKEKFGNPWVVRILITELLLGKQRLPVGSPTIQTILAYGPVLKTEHWKAQGKLHGKTKKNKSDAAVDDSEGSNTDSELVEDSTAEKEQAASDAKAGKKRKRQSNFKSEENEHQGSKPKKRKGGRPSNNEYEENHQQTKKAKNKKMKRATEENNDEKADCITLEDGDKVQDGHSKKRRNSKGKISDGAKLSVKPLWGEQQDYIKLEDDSIKSIYDQAPKKKKKRYPVKKDKFSPEKKFSHFQKKSKKGKNKFK